MPDDEQKRIFAKNLNRYLSTSNKTQKEVADSLGVSPQTFNTWCQGIALPRMGKVQLLADYFGINKTDLIDESTDDTSPLSAKDERDIAKRLQSTLDDLENSQDALMFSGEPLDDETKELLKASLENGLRVGKIMAKRKFSPKKKSDN